MDAHMHTLSLMTTIIYVLSSSASHLTLRTSGKIFQQSLLSHHKFYNQAPALLLANGCTIKPLALLYGSSSFDVSYQQ